MAKQDSQHQTPLTAQMLAAEALQTHLDELLLAAEALSRHVVAGQHGRRKAGQGENFWQFRSYDPSEPAQNIDWRKSAKLDNQYLVRQYEWENAETLHLWCDHSASMQAAIHHPVDEIDLTQAMLTKADIAQLLSLALGVLLSQSGERLSVLHADATISDDFKQIHGRHGAEKLQQALLQMTKAAHQDKLPPNPLHQKAKQIWLGDFYMDLEKINQAMRQEVAQDNSGIILQIFTPEETGFPFKGRIEFYEDDPQQVQLVGDAAQLKTAYQDLFNQHQAGLQEICAKWGWHYLPIRTDQDLKQVMTAVYNSLEKGA